MHVAPTITWAIKGWEGTRRITTRWIDVRKWQVVDVHESMAIHGWNKANIYYTLPRCICTYLTNNIWFKNVGKICAMTNLPKPPLVDVEGNIQFDNLHWEILSWHNLPLLRAPNKFQKAHYLMHCFSALCGGAAAFSIYQHTYANRFMMIFDNLCVCVYRLYSIIASVLGF